MDKKIIKIFGISFAAICFFIMGAIGYLVVTVDQDTIKSKAAEYVHKKTGRDLKIVGDVSWSFFPWVGVEIQNVSLSNAVGFTGDIFARVKKVGVSVKLLPLVFGRIEAGNLMLGGLDLYLVRNRFGVGNWQDLIDFNGEPSVSNGSGSRDFSFKKFTISSVKIGDGLVSWQDQRANKVVKINDLNLICKDINFETSFDVASSFYIKDLDSVLDGKIDVTTKARVDIGKELYTLKDLQIAGKLKNRYAAKPFNFKSSASIDVDLKKQTFFSKDFNIGVSTIKAVGSLRGAKIIDDPNFSGSLVVSDSNPKKTMRMFGFYRYPKSLSQADLKSDLKFASGVIKLLSIEADLGDMKLKGKFEYSKNSSSFNLYLNKFNFDDFNGKNPKSVLSKYDREDLGKGKARSKKTSSSKSSFNFLDKTKLVGSIGVGLIRFDNLKFSDLSVNISGSNGLVNLQKIGFTFYKGKGGGSAVCDLTDNNPKVNLNLFLNNVLMQPFLKDFAGYGKFKGVLGLNTELAMSGISEKAMLSSLNGAGKVSIINGSFSGVDIPYEVRKAHAVINVKPMPQKIEPPHTDFDSLNMSFDVNRGILSTNDLLIQATDYRVVGKGSASLLSKRLDLLLSAYSNNDKNFFVPFKVKGSFTDPSISLDAVVMLKQKVTKMVKDVVKDQIGKHIENLPQGIKDILPF